MSAPTASAAGPCPTVIQIVGRPGTGSLPSTIAPPDHPAGMGGGKKERRGEGWRTHPSPPLLENQLKFMQFFTRT